MHTHSAIAHMYVRITMDARLSTQQPSQMPLALSDDRGDSLSPSSLRDLSQSYCIVQTVQFKQYSSKTI